jgi:hypothetical protein
MGSVAPVELASRLRNAAPVVLHRAPRQLWL